jgi:hypothetical protein
MALTQEDLALLGNFIKDEVRKTVSATAPAPVTEEEAAQTRASIVGVPDVDPNAGPDYYVHLANGKVITSKDSASTHVADPDDGSTQLVIGRYQVGS